MASVNEVYFSLNITDLTFLGGNYTVTDFMVTPGEDSDLKVGQIKEFDDTGLFSFGVDRSSSASVATWFSERIASNQNTFNHEPDELNFAIMGNLILVIGNVNLPNGEDSFIFTNIALAQGSSFLSNNWWFGSKTAVWGETNLVTIVGSGLNSGKNATITFLRGGGYPVNEIVVTSVVFNPK